MQLRLVGCHHQADAVGAVALIHAAQDLRVIGAAVHSLIDKLEGFAVLLRIVICPEQRIVDRQRRARPYAEILAQVVVFVELRVESAIHPIEILREREVHRLRHISAGGRVGIAPRLYCSICRHLGSLEPEIIAGHFRLIDVELFHFDDDRLHGRTACDRQRLCAVGRRAVVPVVDRAVDAGPCRDRVPVFLQDDR